jgi:exodeoxyribonuclease X
MTMPAMIIDFESTDVSKEAEATQLGWRNVAFDDEGELIAEMAYEGGKYFASRSVICRPDRTISYGAMAVSHIMPADLEGALNHKMMVPQYLPEGEAYIIGHNADYDIQVAANAGVDVSQYKVICTQALARELMPDMDSHSLGALTYAINPELARKYCRNAHDAGWDVTFTLWLLEHLCELSNITSMDQLFLASQEARIPKIMPIGNNYKGKLIADMAKDAKDRGFLRWVVKTIKDKPYLVQACEKALITSINVNVSGMER